MANAIIIFNSVEYYVLSTATATATIDLVKWKQRRTADKMTDITASIWTKK